MVSQDTVPEGLRASDEDRENVIGLLRDGSVDGRLSHETFMHRLDEAMRARRLGELAPLISDLIPPPTVPGGWLGRTVGWCSAAGRRAQLAWRAPRLSPLVLPREDRAFVIGRSPSCDFWIRDGTVSWRHAELRRCAAGWLLTDLASTNGTRVNGWRVDEASAVKPGDWVAFGRARFRIMAE